MGQNQITLKKKNYQGSPYSPLNGKHLLIKDNLKNY